MKSIISISFILFLSLFPLNFIFSQEISDVRGETIVEGNIGYTYTVVFESGLSQYTEFEIRTNYGKIDSKTGSSSKTISCSVGANSFSFVTFWPNDCFSDGFILVYKKGESSKTFELKIRKRSCQSSTNNDKIIQGPPTKVYSEEPFSIGATSFTSITDDIDFTYDSGLFEKISSNKGKITLKPRQVVGKRSTSITVVLRHYFSKVKYQWTFDIYGTPHLEKKTEVICPGNNSFDIKNFFSMNLMDFTSTNVTWQGIDNMILVSGQNTNNPIFRASNGIGKIKATVIWQGKDGEKVFNLEETYWVGVPKKVSYISGMKENQSFAPNKSYEMIISPESQFGTTELIWNSFDDKIMIEPFSNGNIYGAYLKIPQVVGTKPFAIQVIPVNSCGKGPELTVWGVVTSSGLRSVIKVNTTSTEEISVKSDFIRSIKIYSMSGTLVYTSHSIDTDFNYKNLNIPKGVYIIEKTYENGQVIREKIVV